MLTDIPTIDAILNGHTPDYLAIQFRRSVHPGKHFSRATQTFKWSRTRSRLARSSLLRSKIWNDDGNNSYVDHIIGSSTAFTFRRFTRWIKVPLAEWRRGVDNRNHTMVNVRRTVLYTQIES